MEKSSTLLERLQYNKTYLIYIGSVTYPSTYYSLEGCEEEIKSLASKSTSIEDKKISTGLTAGQSFCRFGSLYARCKNF